MPSYVALIPARGGSKGLPGKNIKMIHGKPLICWSIEQALTCQHISRVIVSTDCPKIAAIAKEAGAEVPALRPDSLAQDHSSTEDVMIQVADEWLGWSKDTVMVLLQPTSPLRLADSISLAITQFEKSKADSLVSVCESHAFYWQNPSNPKALYDFKHRPRRQDIQPENQNYRENGSIYLTKLDVLKKHHNRLGDKITMFCMQEIESWEIDSHIDFAVVNQLFKESGL